MDRSEECILSIRSLSKKFGGLAAVNDVSFEVPKGVIKSVIGPNGAGKTTLFNLITGLDVPTSGDILFLNEQITGLKPHQRASRGLSRTFQIPQIFGNMTVLENVLIGRHLHGQSGFFDGLLSTPRCRRENREMREYGLSLLERVGLVEKAEDEAGSMAYGEIKLLEIARALASGPKFLLLDECAAGLNAKESSEIAALVTGLRADGVTMLLVEHDIRMVMDLSDEIVVLDFGLKIAEGTPEQIQEDPMVIKVYLGTED